MVIDRTAAVQELVDIHNAYYAQRIADGWVKPMLPSFYDKVSDDDVVNILNGFKKAKADRDAFPDRHRPREIPPAPYMRDDDSPEGSINVVLQKSDVIRMLKGSPAPLGMEWDEQAMQSCSIDELMGLYASINWGQPQPVEEAPRIFIPGR